MFNNFYQWQNKIIILKLCTVKNNNYCELQPKLVSKENKNICNETIDYYSAKSIF